jgi:hypothetical protein
MRGPSARPSGDAGPCRVRRGPAFFPAGTDEQIEIGQRFVTPAPPSPSAISTFSIRRRVRHADTDNAVRVCPPLPTPGPDKPGCRLLANAALRGEFGHAQPLSASGIGVDRFGYPLSVLRWDRAVSNGAVVGQAGNVGSEGQGQPVSELAHALPPTYCELDDDCHAHDYQRQELVMLHHHILPLNAGQAILAGVAFLGPRCAGPYISELPAISVRPLLLSALCGQRLEVGQRP